MTRSLKRKKARAAALTALAAMAVLAPCTAQAVNMIGYNSAVDYTKPNFANSPNLTKFVDSLPGLGSANANNLGNYIPVAEPKLYSDGVSDYYEIGLKQYTQQLHSDLPNTTALRGYYQKGVGDGKPHYLGPLIIAKRGTPVRIKFTNELGIGAAGDLPLPVDTNIMGAGMGPLTMTGAPCDPMMTTCAMYSQNRANIHLHGGLTPWISDGTPHQWITPAGENSTPFLKGVAFQNVPDMVGAGKPVASPAPGDGTGTYYYPNEQSARLMFYHDHSYGITRLNVYAGEAAGYLLIDQAETDLIDGTNGFGANPSGYKVLPDQAGLDKTGTGNIYKYGIPLVIQDKTFVNGNASGALPTTPPAVATPTALTKDVDPNWFKLLPNSAHGDLWFPHEYMPNEDLYNLFPDSPGSNPMGRWDYAPWMIPPMVPLKDILPSPTIIPEAFGDTPLVNGAAFPYLQLQPNAYRFRILNACNDRMLNLQLYYAAMPDGTICKAVPGQFLPDPAKCTEVSMVPASNNSTDPNWPATWPKDGRDGGVPNWNTVGPSMIQIGNEGGFLVKPVVIRPQPIDFDYNRRSVTFGGVTSKALLMPPAVRADVIVDFSSVTPGSVLIMYNDAPAPMPLYDSRNDYFTGAPDQTPAGGAPPTPASFGPNTRTVMQIRIDANGVQAPPYDLATLQTALPQTFAKDQDPILVPQKAYNDAYPSGPLNAANNIYANAVDDSLNVTGQPQRVQKVVLTAPGMGYTKAPTVNFTGGGCTSYPRATAALNGVTGVTLVTAGSGYTSPPTVTFSGGAGKGATAVATISGGVVTVITITNPGSGYTKAPTVTLSGGGATTQATATATITLGSVGTITLSAGTNPSFPFGSCLSAPQVTLTGGGGTGATAASMLANSLVLNGKNLVEGFDMEYGRMNAVLGSTPNLLAPTVGAGAVVGANFYIDPPTEILNGGEPVLWRLSHIGVDSHAIHFHLFNVQVVNRVDWTNTIKPPYDDELGWKETIRTNPFEDIIVAIKPVGSAMKLPFALPDSNRVLDPTMLQNTAGNFQPVAPPPGLPAVAQTTNVMTNFGWEYVWHCHLLGHEENDMMRPIVFRPDLPHATVTTLPASNPPALNFGTVSVGKSKVMPVTVTNTGLAPMTFAGISSDTAVFTQTNNCPVSPNKLAANASCTINVTFRPVQAITTSGHLIINDDSDGVPSSQSVSLVGTGR
ncbi:choice-of-anchor D domain-containing protein [Geomonas sp.]|uniref:choice-of-anchor D domain-containing protein n=1 Tax=Geomonas sp. TaxID=2651584 RepID=UPI002B4615AE|nr:choice-of-anchor D domain-containing protein [Geomonas sp.]HJV33779.1 choice-of-anchor D domain-containing protein [Geomonas sp.]